MALRGAMLLAVCALRFRFSVAALAAVLSLPAGAADAWDGPAFSVPPRSCCRPPTPSTRERPTAVVVLLDERTFVVDEQHRLTHYPHDLSRRLARRRRELGGEHGALAALAPGAPEIRARVITRTDASTRSTRSCSSDAANAAATTRFSTIRPHARRSAARGGDRRGRRRRNHRARREAVFPGGLGVPRIRWPAVPVLHTRVIIDAPESLPLKHITATAAERAGAGSRAPRPCGLDLDQGVIDEMDEMEANLPSDAPAWPSVEFSSGTSWEAVAAPIAT